MNLWSRRARAGAALAAALALTACDLLSDPEQELTEVRVSPALDTIAVGDSIAFTASGVDQKGVPMLLSSYSWRTTNSGVALITKTAAQPGNGSAQVLGAAPGSVQVLATLEGVEGAATLVVLDAPTSP